MARYDVCVEAVVNTVSPRRMHMNSRVDINEPCLTVAEVAERLKVNEETARRLFLNEPGVIVICYPRKGVRVYRTMRIPESIYARCHAVYKSRRTWPFLLSEFRWCLLLTLACTDCRVMMCRFALRRSGFQSTASCGRRRTCRASVIGQRDVPAPRHCRRGRFEPTTRTALERRTPLQARQQPQSSRSDLWEP